MGTNKSENRWHTSSWRALELESLFGRRQATKSATEVLIKRLSHRMVQLSIHGVDVRDVEVLEHRPVRIVEGLDRHTTSVPNYLPPPVTGHCSRRLLSLVQCRWRGARVCLPRTATARWPRRPRPCSATCHQRGVPPLRAGKPLLERQRCGGRGYPSTSCAEIRCDGVLPTPTPLLAGSCG
jgi:hypothetical protein